MSKSTQGGERGAGKPASLTPAGKYKCSKCSNSITTYVSTYGPPVCTKHSDGPIKMEVKK
jgi:hypothetical protein